MKTQMNKTDLQVFHIPIDRRRFFKSMALASAVILSLWASYFVAMTVVPLYCAKLVKKHEADEEVGEHSARLAVRPSQSAGTIWGAPTQIPFAALYPRRIPASVEP